MLVASCASRPTPATVCTVRLDVPLSVYESAADVRPQWSGASYENPVLLLANPIYGRGMQVERMSGDATKEACRFGKHSEQWLPYDWHSVPDLWLTLKPEELPHILTVEPGDYRFVLRYNAAGHSCECRSSIFHLKTRIQFATPYPE